MCTEMSYVPINSSEMLAFLYLSLCAKYLLLEDIVLTFRTLLPREFKEASIQFFKLNDAFDKVFQQTCETPHQRNGAVEHTLTEDSGFKTLSDAYKIHLELSLEKVRPYSPLQDVSNAI